MKSWDLPSDTTFWRTIAYILIAIVVLLGFITCASIYFSADYFFKSDYQSAATIVAVGSGASTIILAVVTAWYTSLTRELVSEAEKDREQRRELRKRDKAEEWHEDLVFNLRMIQQVWERGFARPDGFTSAGDAYVSLESNMDLWRELDNYFGRLPHIVSKRPAPVDEALADRAEDIHIRWVSMTNPDIGGEAEDTRILRSDSPFDDVEEFEEVISEHLDQLAEDTP